MALFVVLMGQLDLMTSHLDQRSKSLVDGIVVSKHLGYVGVDLDNVRASAIALKVLTSDATFHRREVVLWAKFVWSCVILFHSLVSHVVLPGAH